MEKNDVRKSLPGRLDVAELEYDIKRLSAELDYHKSKTVIFEQTIQAQQAELDEMLGISECSAPRGEIYK